MSHCRYGVRTVRAQSKVQSWCRGISFLRKLRGMLCMKSAHFSNHTAASCNSVAGAKILPDLD